MSCLAGLCKTVEISLYFSSCLILPLCEKVLFLVMFKADVCCVRRDSFELYLIILHAD